MTDDEKAADREYLPSRMREVTVERALAGQAKATFAIRLDAADVTAIRVLASDAGIGATQLVRRWVLERLAAEEHRRDLERQITTGFGEIVSAEKVEAVLREMARNVASFERDVSDTITAAARNIENVLVALTTAAKDSDKTTPRRH
jgi:hypothetical protein